MPAVPMLPAGPADHLQRLEYLSGRGGVELKTARVNEPWAHHTAETVKSWGGPVTWHIPDAWNWRMGFADFDVEELLAKVAVIDPLIEAGLVDAIVSHCGSLRWVDDYDPAEGFTERYTSRFTHTEILDQIERHLPVFGRLVARYGSKLLIENTPITLAREVYKPGRTGRTSLLGLSVSCRRRSVHLKSRSTWRGCSGLATCLTLGISPKKWLSY